MTPTMTTNSFTCTHCGQCCSSIVVHLNTDNWVLKGTFGMLLLPKERPLFDKDQVEPLWRSTSETLGYQMVKGPCPHWIEGKCSIYSKRPLACRSYPMSWQLTYWLVDTTCPPVEEHKENQNFSQLFPQAKQVKRYQIW